MLAFLVQNSVAELVTARAVAGSEVFVNTDKDMIRRIKRCFNIFPSPRGKGTRDLHAMASSCSRKDVPYTCCRSIAATMPAAPNSYETTFIWGYYCPNNGESNGKENGQ